jgi:methylamine dehydrogenase accessory protein MauD
MSALVLSNIVLWCMVIALALVVWALVRQIGVLHERIAPAGALMLRQGPTVGEQSPRLDVLDLQGHAHRIGAARTDGRSTLLVFVSPTCPVCKALLPVLTSSRTSERNWLEIILASDGDRSAHERFVSAHGLQSLAYVSSTDLGLAFQVSRLPTAAIIDENGILRARGLVNSREHLESLFEAQRRGVGSLQELFEHEQKSRAA